MEDRYAGYLVERFGISTARGPNFNETSANQHEIRVVDVVRSGRRDDSSRDKWLFLQPLQNIFWCEHGFSVDPANGHDRLALRV